MNESIIRVLGSLQGLGQTSGALSSQTEFSVPSSGLVCLVGTLGSSLCGACGWPGPACQGHVLCAGPGLLAASLCLSVLPSEPWQLGEAVGRPVGKTRPPFLDRLSVPCPSQAVCSFPFSADLSQADEVRASGARASSVLEIRANKPWIPWNLSPGGWRVTQAGALALGMTHLRHLLAPWPSPSLAPGGEA